MTQTQTLAGNILEYAIYQYADEKEKHMWILWQNAQKGWKLKSSQAEVDEIKHHCCHLQNYLSLKVLYFYAIKRALQKKTVFSLFCAA